MAQAAAILEPQTEAAAPSGMDLVINQSLNPVQLFSDNGLDPILERIERETRAIVLDISTDKGRKQVASLAHKIAKSKTAIDKAGKDLVAGWKQQAKKVDTERARAWDRLEALQKVTRQPLTEWEERETKRVAAHEQALTEIAAAGPNAAANWMAMPVETMQDRLAELQSAKAKDWQEFDVRAKQEIETAIAAVGASLVKRQKHDAEQAELARLRKEEEERKQREHEQRIAAEAAEKARKEAEDKARLKAEAEAARVSAEIAQVEQAQKRIQREKEEADARAAKAEKDRIAAEEKAKRDAEEAEKRRVAEARAAEEKRLRDIAEAEARAMRQAEEAARKERERVEAEKKAEAEAAAKREADKKHRTIINNAAICALAANGRLSEDDARIAVEAIAAGEIPYIRIQY